MDPVDPTDPIDPKWLTPCYFDFSRLLHFVIRNYYSPRILNFAPLSSFVQNEVYSNLLYFSSKDHGFLCATAMEHDKVQENPNLFVNLSEEDFDDDCPPLIGRRGGALRSRSKTRFLLSNLAILQ